MKIWEDLRQDIEKNIPSDTECELKMMHSKSALTGLLILKFIKM